MAATRATNMKASAGASATRSKDSKTDSKMAQEILLELTKQQELLEKEKSEKFIAPSMLKQSTLESNTFGAGTIGTPTVTNRTINTMTPDFRHHPKQSRDIYTPSLSVSMSNNTFIDEKLQKRYSQVSSIHPRRRGVAATHAISGRLNNNNNNYVQNSNNNRNKNNNNRDDERGEKRLNEIEEQSDSGSNSVSNDDEEAAGAVVNGEKGDSNNNNNNNNNVCDSEEKVSKERIKFSNVEERINYAIEKSKINYEKREIYSGKAQYEQELDLNDDFLAMARKYGFNVGKENHVSSVGNNNDMEKVEIVAKQDGTHLNLKLKDFISMHCDGDAIDDYYYSDENDSDNTNNNSNENENENENDNDNYTDNE